MAEEPRSDSAFGCLLQLFWSLVGPGLLLATGSLLIVNHPPFGSWPDYVLLALAILVGLARVLDRKPDATSGNRLKYLAALAAAVVAILVVAHVVAPRFA